MIQTFGYLEAVHIMFVTFLSATGWLLFWIVLILKVVVYKSNNSKGVVVMTGREFIVVAVAILAIILVMYIGFGEVKS